MRSTSEYALRAMVCLARHPAEQGAKARQLAEEAGIPLQYLSKILATLTRSGLLEATRGAHGGYRLAVPAEDVLLVEIVRPFEGDDASPGCLLGARADCSDAHPCSAHESWKKVRKTYLDFVQKTTLVHICGPEQAAPLSARKQHKRKSKPGGRR